ncbi:hypothetical protein COF68_06190 [Bacillus toyonensis]|uniref:hypothetical protein n=1 Tax=Bacillus toyonensis TaxID=155322 RepID=UPI000BFB1EB5|nr:hypothetical protein [Bacillus toyonensis]PHE64423.1 hypothetical protein COF68_06190 [Bacillus toyonensis]
MCLVFKCNCVSNNFYRSILEGKGRSIIVDRKSNINCNMEHFIATLVNNNKYHLTLNEEGLNKLLKKKNLSKNISNFILNKVLKSEIAQYNKLEQYLSSQKSKGKSVTYIRVKDNTVITNNEYETDYSLPLEDLFTRITELGYRPISVDSKEPSRHIDREDMGRYLFSNSELEGLLSIFIDVTEGDI